MIAAAVYSMMILCLVGTSALILVWFVSGDGGTDGARLEKEDAAAKHARMIERIRHKGGLR
jgi:hypothetical protein